MLGGRRSECLPLSQSYEGSATLYAARRRSRAAGGAELPRQVVALNCAHAGVHASAQPPAQ